jgi:hypothetical protein
MEMPVITVGTVVDKKRIIRIMGREGEEAQGFADPKL